MTMPIDLVLVRHGQSEQNIALHAAKSGNTKLVSDPRFLARPASDHPLTKLGRKQAQLAGEWLRKHDLGRFDRRYSSAYVRAMQTAALLDTEGPAWYVDPTLREREWGDHDSLSWEKRESLEESALLKRDANSFYWIPANGESIAQLTVRLARLLDALHRECSDKRVLIVCHGEVMWAFRFMLERMSIEEWMQLEASQDPRHKIHNCQIIHYTRRNPSTGELEPHLNWRSSICPTDETLSDSSWQAIRRKTYTNDELLRMADKVSQIYNYDDEGEVLIA
ncbi:histidine phosphatase family protein [Candidatus Saccharibacteria bacterium]|nr:histidine phosphatase family protein [Candidatus Saccharibacteria bacterium]